MDTIFSNRLKQFRLRRSLTVSQVASELGIAPSTYREWEYGRKIQGHECYLKLATLFEISLEELFRGQSSNKSIKADLMTDINEMSEILARHKKKLESFF